MENNRKICPSCGYIAEPDFVFCAKCGTPLVQPTVQQPIMQQPIVQQPIAQENAVWQAEPIKEEDVYRCSYDGQAVVYEKTLNGIPTAEVSDYIGKNRHRILTKFFKQSYGAKGGWNWMALIFGIIGVPFVWFFYRKMKKQGIILLIISLVLSLAAGLTYGGMIAAVSEPATEYFETVAELNKEYGYYSEYSYNVPFVYLEDTDSSYATKADAALKDFEDAVNKSDNFAALSMITQILSYLNLGLAITVAVFADHWYYKKAMADLSELNRFRTPDCETVMATGGTKTKAAVLSGILGTLAMTFVTVMAIVPFALPVLESIMKIMF